jgi:serine/threonine protein kinase
MALQFQLTSLWKVTGKLGHGSFGVVYEVTDGANVRALKVMSGAASGWRDMLVNEIPAGPFALQILDSAEVDGDILLLMPKADRSLRDAIESSAPFGVAEATKILGDVAAALAALETAQLIHRDLKPENILLHEGTWKLSDFGEARYSDATTSASTHLRNLTPEYAAPERWWEERATIKVDVYSWGVIAHELLRGERPIPGPRDQLRDQHLNSAPAPLGSANPALNSLVQLSLFKAADSRPAPQSLRRRLQSLSAPIERHGFEELQKASAVVADSIAMETLAQSQLRLKQRRQEDLFDSAMVELDDLVAQFQDMIMDNSIAAELLAPESHLMRIKLGNGTLAISKARAAQLDLWEGQVPFFEIVGMSGISISQDPAGLRGYRARSHSLWYGDIQHKGDFGWFELSFFNAPGRSGATDIAPSSWDPDNRIYRLFQGFGSDLAVGRAVQDFNYESVSASAAQWALWLARASTSALVAPQGLPESQPSGTWRTAGMDAATRIVPRT